MIFFVAFIISLCATPVAIKLARRFGILDEPSDPRKIHASPIPLLGGIAPFLTVMALVVGILIFFPAILIPAIPLKNIVGLLLGATVIMIGGALDDKYRLPPRVQIIFPILASLIVIAAGIGARKITNPFGAGTISLVAWEHTLFWWRHVGYRITLPADLFTFVWIMGMMYTTKFLDGLDGLVSGLTTIGALMIFFLTMTVQWFQPPVGILALIVAGAFAGFLPWNFNPAKIFLGEGGSLLAGFLLGTLAIISGGKIATTLLVLGIPVLDVAWVIARRIFWEKKSPTEADRKHLHFRLLDAGLTHRQAVIVLYVCATIFGTLTLVLQSKEKLIALVVLAALMIIGASLLVAVNRHRSQKEK